MGLPSYQSCPAPPRLCHTAWVQTKAIELVKTPAWVQPAQFRDRSVSRRSRFEVESTGSRRCRQERSRCTAEDRRCGLSLTHESVFDTDLYVWSFLVTSQEEIVHGARQERLQNEPWCVSTGTFNQSYIRYSTTAKYSRALVVKPQLSGPTSGALRGSLDTAEDRRRGEV